MEVVVAAEVTDAAGAAADGGAVAAAILGGLVEDDLAHVHPGHLGKREQEASAEKA